MINLIGELLQRHAESACEKQSEHLVDGFFDHTDMMKIVSDQFGKFAPPVIRDVQDLVRYSFLANISGIDFRKNVFKFGHSSDVRNTVREKYVKLRKQLTSKLRNESSSQLIGIANGAATLPEQLREVFLGYVEGDLGMSDMARHTTDEDMENLFKGIGRIFTSQEERKDKVREALTNFDAD